jgi:hypothetical protein
VLPTFAHLLIGDSPSVNAERTDPAGSARAARLTQNEALFRDVNEQINALNDFGAQLDTFGVVCECGRDTCGDVIYVHRSLYETVRAQSDRFIVASGHVLPEIEKVVEQHEGFAVVDKHDGTREKIAALTDPRA